MYVGSLVYHREADWYEHRGDKVGNEGIGGHLLKIASKLLCDNSCCRSTRTDDACEHGFGKYEAVARKMKRHGAQLTVVDLAECHEQHKEHERRQHCIEHRFGCRCKSVERRN